MGHIVYKFTSYKHDYNKINGVYFYVRDKTYDYREKSNIYHISFYAYKESDLVLFALANPEFRLESKVVYSY